MHDTPRGAAHVPFVACLVLLIGATVFAYGQVRERRALQGRLDSFLDAARTPGGPAPSDESIRDSLRFANGLGAQFKQRLEEIGDAGSSPGGEEQDVAVSPEKLRATVRKFLDFLSASPDGTVLSVGERQDFVVIDIGKRNNNLLAGTNFDVFAIGKGGQRISKGTIKVIRVDADTSKCSVLSVFDQFQPIAPGDWIVSPLFSPTEAVHLVLLGHFVGMEKADVARRLQNISVVVDDAVNIHTSGLVLGQRESADQPLEESVDYRLAAIFGIPRISEDEFIRFSKE